MKDEIKEFNEEKYVEMLEDGTLYDYITNLQEENEFINEELNNITDYARDLEIYKSRNEKAKSLTNRTIEIIKQQPSGNDEWILERLNGINYCLGGDEEC